MDTTTVKGKAEATAKDPVEARMTASLTQIRTYNKDLTKPETPDPLFSFYMELQKAFPKITRRDITDRLSSNIIFTQETPTEKRTKKFEKFLGAFPDMSEDLKAQGRAALVSTISGVEREIPTAPAPRPEIVTEAGTSVVTDTKKEPSEEERRQMELALKAVHERTIKINEGRAMTPNDVNETLRSATDDATNNAALAKAKTQLSSAASVEIAKNDTAFGHMHKLMLAAIDSDKIKTEDKIAFLRATSDAFKFITTEPRETDLAKDATNLEAAFATLATNSVLKGNAELDGVLKSSMKGYQDSIRAAGQQLLEEGKAAEALLAEGEEEEVGTEADNPNDPTPTGATPTPPNAKKSKEKDPIDEETRQKAKIAAETAKGVVAIAGISTAAVLCPPLALAGIVIMAIWWAKKSGKNKDEKDPALEEVDASVTAEQFLQQTQERNRPANRQAALAGASLDGGKARPRSASETALDEVGGADQEGEEAEAEKLGRSETAKRATIVEGEIRNGLADVATTIASAEGNLAKAKRVKFGEEIAHDDKATKKVHALTTIPELAAAEERAEPVVVATSVTTTGAPPAPKLPEAVTVGGNTFQPRAPTSADPASKAGFKSWQDRAAAESTATKGNGRQ